MGQGGREFLNDESPIPTAIKTPYGPSLILPGVSRGRKDKGQEWTSTRSYEPRTHYSKKTIEK